MKNFDRALSHRRSGKAWAREKFFLASNTVAANENRVRSIVYNTVEHRSTNSCRVAGLIFPLQELVNKVRSAFPVRKCQGSAAKSVSEVWCA